jgi:hypothetical protein|tara:strand:- start:41 stop:1045 length:1005 start_codon:yes stop_codon:yes gene_type:complete
METIVISPFSSEQDIRELFNDDTRFAIIPDHFPGNPLGYKTDIDNPHWVLNLLDEFPKCIFLSDYNKVGVYKKNFVPIPMMYLSEVFGHDWTYDFNMEKRPYTSSIIGGQTRINRTLASFWLAKNYPLDQLKYHYTENDDITAVQQFINPNASLHPRKFLFDTWDKNTLEWNNNQRLFNHLMPDIISQAYVHLGTESINPHLEAPLTEKTLSAWLGGTLLLPLGDYCKNEVLAKYGFESFSNVFELRSSRIPHHHEVTIGVLEDNRDFLMDHSAVEQAWHENIGKIIHNSKQAADKEFWKAHQADNLSLVKDAVEMVDFSKIHKSAEFLKIFLQ